MFSAGEFVVYGRSGVCRVEGTELRGSPGEEKLYYILTVLRQDYVIRTPVQGGRTALRAIMTREEADALIDSIPQRDDPPFFSTSLPALREHYRQALEARDSGALLGLTISLFHKKEETQRLGRKFGVIDERTMKEAEQLLFDELSFALDIPYEDVMGYIDRRLTAGQKN